MLFFGLPVATAQVDNKYQVKPPVVIGDSLYCWDIEDVIKLGNAYKDMASLEKQRNNLYLLYQLGVINEETFNAQLDAVSQDIDNLKAENAALKRTNRTKTVLTWLKGFGAGIVTTVVGVALVLMTN